MQTGKIIRGAKMRLLRDGSIVHEGAIASLQRVNDDVREVLTGYECGIHLDVLRRHQRGRHHRGIRDQGSCPDEVTGHPAAS